MDISFFLTLGGIALLSALIITPWVAIVAKKFGAVQEPPEKVLERIMELRKEKKISDQDYEAKLMAARRRPNKKTIILWGGLGYIVPFLVISIVVLLRSQTINLPVEDFPVYMLWFATIFILFLMGMLDDVLEFSGKVQFSFYILATLILAFSSIDIGGFRNPFTGDLVNITIWKYATTVFSVPISFLFPGDIVVFLWALPLMMGLKIQGGIDGLMEGNVFWGALFLFIVSFLYNQPAAALFSIVLAGAMLGFLYYNFYPHKIISGSSGKSVLGFIVAGIAIIGASKFAISLIVFAIPLIDFIWVYLRRIIYYKPKTPLQLFLISDRFHFHHRLLKLGYTEVQIALFQYGITSLWGILAVLFPAYKWVVLLVSWTVTATIIIYTTVKSYET